MEGLKGIYSHWDLRSFIMSSMILQSLLMIWTYQRKKSSSQPVRRIAWLAAFLAADFVATFSLGGIFHVNMDPEASDSPQNKYLLALWAPFILLHLGRHTSITAFSLAENEFWPSHLIRFLYYESTALAILILALPETRFHYTSSVLFITGTLKFGERIVALKRGSMNELRSSTFKEANPGLSIDRISTDIANRSGDLESGDLNNVPDNHTARPDVASTNAEVQSLCAAYHCFTKYKGLYLDNIFEDERGGCFGDMNIVDTFTWMEMELSFAHDLFYTKNFSLHNRWGWISRVISLVSIFSALVVFSCVHKHGFLKPDVVITYSLLSIALSLEVVSFLESMVSNQTIVQVGFQAGQKWRCLEDIIHRLRNVKRKKFPRRSTLMGQFSLLSFCFNDYKSRSCLKRVLDFFELKELWNNYYYTSYISIDAELKQRIFDGVRIRTQEEQRREARRIEEEQRRVARRIEQEQRQEARGIEEERRQEASSGIEEDQRQEARRTEEEHRQEASTFYIHPISSGVAIQMTHNEIFKANIKREFEKCLLVWHLATDLCHRTSCNPPIDLKNAKYLSDYLLYLLVIHPSMLSSLITTELISYRYACAASVELYSKFKPENDGNEVKSALQDICNKINNNPDSERAWRESLLVDAFELAQELVALENDRVINVWEVVFKVWVDMLSYAAYHSQRKYHAEKLGTGGEFITYVWLFIAHYQIEVEETVA